MQVRDSVFVVTGGVSGLGAATAKMIVSGGGKVILADVNPSAGDAVKTELGASAHFIQTDITSEESAKACFTAAVTIFGGLHGLVNCAGIAPAERVVGRDRPHHLSTYVQVINVNLIGTFNMVRLAADMMSKGKPNADDERGVIVNTASVAAFDGQIGQAAYASSKGGVVALTLPLARELARFGVRVVTIAPGLFETPMLLGLPQEVQDSLGKTVPFPPRLGKPGEFAAMVRHIIENPYLNGEVIRLDGAIRLTVK
jgi:NAD(P)-dependent dehydrogenase (short-subunit alcohol dehydrogenase family)